jgi:nicotinate-nucleotide pyrophosphorylase (carboxylating)|tara:strand:+ start:2066 stop:2968 length:903 start_codon:yes stop_codon:yes gene_type:complete
MRNELVLEFWDRNGNLNLRNNKYSSFVKNLIKIQLKEDIVGGDITTESTIPRNKKIKAKIISNQDGIVAGIEECSLFTASEKLIKIKNDGDIVKKGDVIVEITGNASNILSYERTLLNIMQRMSGIATQTYNTKKLIKNKCQITATRKTLLHLIDKKAVVVGGGLTHRLNLNDFILIKDNHLKILDNDVKKALKLAVKNSKSRNIEIEVKDEKEAMEAAKTIFNLKSDKLYVILFDNMEATIIKDTISKINNIKNNILFEASGNINEKNIKEYSETGVDVVSLGMLTHSVKAFDMSLEIK